MLSFFPWFRCLRFQERRVRGNRDRLTGRTDLKGEVDACGLQFLDRDPRPDVLFESGDRHVYFIRAGGKIAKLVIARGSGRGR
jgi:hypothetical protein